MIIYRCDVCKKEAPAELDDYQWGIAGYRKPYGWHVGKKQWAEIHVCSTECQQTVMQGREA